MVYGTYNELVTGAYKPTYNWGASHCATVSSEDVPFNPERAAVFLTPGTRIEPPSTAMVHSKLRSYTKLRKNDHSLDP